MFNLGEGIDGKGIWTFHPARDTEAMSWNE